MDLISQWLETVAAWSGIQAWASKVFLVVLVALLLDFFQRRLMRRLEKAVRLTSNNWDDAIFNAAARPLSFVIWVVGITLAAQFVPAASESGLLSSESILIIRQVGIIVALAWFLLRLARGIENNIIRAGRDNDQAMDETTVHALGRLIRIAIIITVILMVMDTLGFSVAGLLAAGGIGGIAIGLAAKDMLANFFGGFTIFLDRPFSVGDWVLSPDRAIEGVVEKIGWRQTTIRKFDRRPLYVPNAAFTTIAIENPSRMTHRRIYEILGIRYDDVDQMASITQVVKDLLKNHPEIDSSQTLLVYFNAFGGSSLDFFIYCLTRTTDWQRYHEVKQDVLLKIADIIKQHGAEFAFPTSTIHLAGPPELTGVVNESGKEQSV